MSSTAGAVIGGATRVLKARRGHTHINPTAARVTGPRVLSRGFSRPRRRGRHGVVQTARGCRHHRTATTFGGAMSPAPRAGRESVSRSPPHTSTSAPVARSCCGVTAMCDCLQPMCSSGHRCCSPILSPFRPFPQRRSLTADSSVPPGLPSGRMLPMAAERLDRTRKCNRTHMRRCWPPPYVTSQH